MATHQSAKKRARQNTKRALRNRSIKSSVKTAVRAFREALGAKDGDLTKTTLATAARSVRKASTAGVVHKRTASRLVSRLAKAFNKSRATATT